MFAAATSIRWLLCEYSMSCICVCLIIFTMFERMDSTRRSLLVVFFSFASEDESHCGSYQVLSSAVP